MKILFLIQRYHPVIGGSENIIKSFVEYLSKNHNVTVYTTNANSIDSFWNKKDLIETESSENVKRFDFISLKEIPNSVSDGLTFATSYPGPFSVSLWKKLVVSKIDFDLIVASAFPYDHILPAFVASKKWKIPLITIPLIHEKFPSLYLNGFRLSLLENSDSVLVLTDREKSILVDNGIDVKKIKQIKVPVKSQIISDSEISDYKKKLGIKNNQKILLYIGSKSFVKGIIHVIEAMKKVWKIQKNSVLIIIGSETKDFTEYYTKLSNSIKSKIIHFKILNDYEKHLSFEICDVFALPSKSESLGLVYIEAWSHQKPVIACNIPTSRELIDDHKNGILVKFGDIEKLACEIMNLFSNSDMCVKLGRNGQQKSIPYTENSVFETFKTICSNTVQKPNL